MKQLNLSRFDDLQIISRLQMLLHEERKITTEILQYLREVERRQIYAKRGYSSLFEFTTKFLGYSEGAAARRISAMRLLKDIPEIERKIMTGELNLTSLAKVQSFLKAEKKPSNEFKREVLARVESKSTREVERELLKLNPEHVPQERVRPLTETTTEIRIVVDQQLKADLDEIRSLWSHLNPSMNYAQVIKKMAQKILQEKSKTPKTRKTKNDRWESNTSVY